MVVVGGGGGGSPSGGDAARRRRGWDRIDLVAGELVTWGCGGGGVRRGACEIGALLACFLNIHLCNKAQETRLLLSLRHEKPLAFTSREMGQGPAYIFPVNFED